MRKKAKPSKPVRLRTPKASSGRGRAKPFPAYSLESTLVIARGIADNNAGKPYARLSLAEALKLSPDSSGFRQRITSSSAYGLTTGGYTAPQLSLTELGKSITQPRSDEEQRRALKSAVLHVPLFKKLFEHFDQNKIPNDANLKNTLVRDYGIESNDADSCISLFKANGNFVGIIRSISGAHRVMLDGSENVAPEQSDEGGELEEEQEGSGSPPAAEAKLIASEDVSNRRMFIAHGGNKGIINQLKDIITFGKFDAIIADEHETPAHPLSNKVLNDMRSCRAGIIHVESAQELIDAEGKKQHILNQNVLIEIGAAMALYPGRYILLWQKGVPRPSNLEGLYRCEYEGDKLDADSVMKLLKAINEFK